MEFALDLMQTTALAMIFFLLGRVIVAHVEFLRRVCIPAPVVGGLVFALIHLALHSAGVVTFTFDETLKNAFMIWFFTSVGYGASFKVLARGIKPVLVFLLLAGVMVVIQDLVGAGLAQVFQLDGRLGLCMGSIPLVGGHVHSYIAGSVPVIGEKAPSHHKILCGIGVGGHRIRGGHPLRAAGGQGQ